MSRTLFFAIGVVILDAMGIGLLMPVLPDILAQLQGIDPTRLQETHGENPIREIVGVGMWLTAVYMAMQFICGPTLGNLSDRFGRRRVLLVSLFALGIDYLILGFAGTVWVLFIGRILAGIAGATYGTAYAAVADMSSQGDKAKNFGFIGAGFGIGFILGPALGGALAGLDARAPIFAAAALSFLNFGFGYFFFEETLAKHKRRVFSWTRANPFGAFAQIRALPHIQRWLLAAFIFGLTFTVYPAVWSYYGRVVAGWNAQDISLSLAVIGVSFAFVQIVLLGPMVSRFGEQRVLKIGIWAALISFIGLGLAQNGWHIYLMVPASALAIVINPMIQSLVSNAVGEDVQGEIQGLNPSIAAMSSVISPFIMVGSFWLATPAEPDAFRLPGTPFLICAALMIGLLFLVQRRKEG